MPKWADHATERKHRHELRRETILQAAAKCFNRSGYHGTTIGEIARELHVSKAALYYYVKNKEEILFQCHQAALDIGLEGIQQALAQASTPDERLRMTLFYYIDGMTSHLKGTVVLLEEGALARRHRRRINERRNDYERMLRKIIEEGISAGIFRRCDPKLIAFAILGAIGWIPKWYDAAGERSGKEIAETFSSYLVHGLETCSSSSRLGGDPRVGKA